MYYGDWGGGYSPQTGLVPFFALEALLDITNDKRHPIGSHEYQDSIRDTDYLGDAQAEDPRLR